MKNIEMNDSFLFSIIVPVNNRPKCVSMCLSSVLNQIDNDTQLIVVDDGSGLETKLTINELLSNFVSSNPQMNKNIKLISQQNCGPSSARNSGIKAATGKYLMFVDGDDKLSQDFLSYGKKLVSLQKNKNVDLFIFEIALTDAKSGKVISGNSTLTNNRFSNANEFASKIIINHKYMWYSQSNKFYKRSIVKHNNIIFDESVDFGEDRYFNYEYLLKIKGQVLTDKTTMLEYYQYDFPTLSSKTHLHYFDNVINLHEEKIKCLFSLSKNTSDKQKREYQAYDICNEINHAIQRFDKNPEEEKYTIKQINKIIFIEEPKWTKPLDYIVVLGSYKCKYRVQRAYEIFTEHKQAKFIVCGGAKSHYHDMTESKYMADYLMNKGVPASSIIIENTSETTTQNVVEFINKIFDTYNYNKLSASNKKEDELRIDIAVVSGGFHLKRVKKTIINYLASVKSKAVSNESNYAKAINLVKNIHFHYFAAYGPHTKPENWYKDDKWKKLVFNELNNRLTEDINFT